MQYQVTRQVHTMHLFKKKEKKKKKEGCYYAKWEIFVFAKL